MFDPTQISSPGYYGPGQTALLLLDFHSLFIQKAGQNAAAAAKVAARMRVWAKSQGIWVLHGLIDVYATPYSTCKDTGRFIAITSGMQSSGGEEASELLQNGEDEFTFTRQPGYVSALKSAGFDDFLREKGIKSLILTGLSTSGCILRTAMAATDAEYVVSVLSDGCADADQGLHDIIMGKVLNSRGYVTTASEFQEGFSRAMNQKAG